MQLQTIQDSSTGSLDPQAVALAKAIRQVETGGNFQAQGKSGEYGGYQYTPDTWAKDSTGAGVSVPLKQATPEQQNQVAYTKIKSLKDAGYNPGQIASIWNSGQPDAYLDPKYKGVNKNGVQYDVPAYAKSVATAYQQLKSGQQVGIDPNNPSSIASTNPVQAATTSQSGQDTSGTGVGNFISNAIQTIFPGKQTGEAIGTLGGLALEKVKSLLGGQDNSKFYDTSAPTPLQVGGDIAQGALMIGTGLPEAGASTEAGISALGGAKSILPTAESALGRIGQSGLIGAGFGATNALKEGKTNLKDIETQGLVGTAGGLLAGGVGELISKAAQYLPERITRSFVPGLSEDTTKYAVNKGLGSPSKMLNESDNSINELGTKLGQALKNPVNEYVQPTGQQILQQVAEQFPDAGFTGDDILSNLKKLVPLKASLINKLGTNQEMTLEELHTLNSALGKSTFKTVFDDPTVKAGKEVGSAFYHTISDLLKTAAPDSVPLFDDLSKEYQLNAALKQVIRRAQKGRMLTLRDIVAFTSGLGLGGPAGGLGAVVAEKALVNPTVNLGAAGLISNLGGSTARQIGGAVRSPLLSLISK